MSAASGPFPYAIAEALALPDTYYEHFRDDLRSKRDHPGVGRTHVRFAFCKEDDVLQEAAARLRGLLS